MTEFQICPICGHSFQKRNSDANKGFSIFCSKVCFDNYQRRHQKFIACKICGKIFLKRGKRYDPDASCCSLICEKQYRRQNKLASKNPMWKDENVGYSGIHLWVRCRKPRPDMCERCGKNLPYDLANISQHYHRELSDWKWLCRKCHMIEDGRINNLKQFGVKK